MEQYSARRSALAALRAWSTQRRFAHSIASEIFAEARLGTRDRAFALELFYGVLRNLTLLDFWIDVLRGAKTDSNLRDILRLGVYQLFFLKVPQHAAVHETVELAPKNRRAVINAVLRSAARQEEDLRRRAEEQPLFIRASHPQFLIARWGENFGADAVEAICRWNNQPSPIYGRVNRLKITREEFLRRYVGSESVPNHSNFVQFKALPKEALDNGDCYVQDPSTIISCHLLDPQPGENVLDACAAPGGKTAYIAELMKNEGRIIACDLEPKRINLLEDNVRRLGATIVQTSQCDWESDRIPQDVISSAPFDRILIDAPCSNTGVMRRRVDVRWRLHESDLVQMPRSQFKIIKAVLPLLRSEGLLVYSTCSLEPEENDHVVRRTLAEKIGLDLREQIYSLPFQDKFDGAFAASIVRTADACC